MHICRYCGGQITMTNVLAHEDCRNLRDNQQKVGNAPNQSPEIPGGDPQNEDEVGNDSLHVVDVVPVTKRKPGRPPKNA